MLPIVITNKKEHRRQHDSFIQFENGTSCRDEFTIIGVVGVIGVIVAKDALHNGQTSFGKAGLHTVHTLWEQGKKTNSVVSSKQMIHSSIVV
jgi:hypothetical protein